MTMNIRIFSLRETPEKLHEITAYFQQQWASEDSMAVYEDALRRCIGAKNRYRSGTGYRMVAALLAVLD